MLKGAIVDSNGKDFNSQSKNLLKHARITTKNIKSKGNNQLEVKNNIGIVNIHIPKIRKQYQDFYITLYIKRGNPDSNYTVNVNNYFNNRLYNNSVYKTGINTQLYRTQPDKNGNISIKLSPNGGFKFKLLNLSGENYKTLKTAHHNANFNMDYNDIKMV